MVFSEFRSIFATPELSFLIGKVFFDPKTMFLKPQRKRERERETTVGTGDGVKDWLVTRDCLKHGSDG